MRQKPEDGEAFGWDDFERVADALGYGIDPEDWGAWWDCWKSGFSASVCIAASVIAPDTILVVRTEEEIDDLKCRCYEQMKDQATRYPHFTYEQGVMAALDWLLDTDDYEDPMEA